MLLDINREYPTPKTKSKCPCCQTLVIAKCGTKKVHHWAHKSKIECDHWWDNETDWHRLWKASVIKEYQEIIVGNHRADIKLPSGMVIELQNSRLTDEETLEREVFYDKMIWVFNGDKFKDNFKFHLKEDGDPDWCAFYWHRHKSWIANCQKPVWIDLGDKVLMVGKFNHKEEWKEFKGQPYQKKIVTGWGFLRDKIEAQVSIFGKYIDRKIV